MEAPVEKGEQLWSGEGIAICATDQADRLIMEFAEPPVCAVAVRICGLLKRHTLASSLLEQLNGQSVLIRRVEPLPLQVLVDATPGESRVIFAGNDGQPLSLDEAKALDGVTERRLEYMADVAAHAGRSLRAHLMPQGVERIRLRLRFGLTAEGACLLQVVNPFECHLGTTDMEALANLLGG